MLAPFLYALRVGLFFFLGWSYASAAEEFRFLPEDKLQEDLVGPVKRVSECVYLGKRDRKANCGSSRFFQFDPSGLLVGREFREEPHWQERRTYMYDPVQRRIRITEKGVDRFTVQFDPSGRVSEERVLHDHQGRDVRYTVRHDSLGRKMSMTGFHRTPTGDSIFLEERFSYDARGSLVRHTTHSTTGGDSEENHTYTYDARGGLQEKRSVHQWSHGEPSRYRTRYRLDRKGRPILETQTGDGQVVHTRIAYDDRGNWIRKVVTIAGSPTHTTERIVEYY